MLIVKWMKRVKSQVEKSYIALTGHDLTMEFCLLNNKSILTCRIQKFEHAPLTSPVEMDCCTKPNSMKIPNENYIHYKNENSMD
ncbi:hypothetical protein HanRHA438_Chr07g0297641 [Helianthus annuus]|nr:hypothetical protein HanRHA438_Chr07g0297641 [Helianthus annuus]